MLAQLVTAAAVLIMIFYFLTFSCCQAQLVPPLLRDSSVLKSSHTAISDYITATGIPQIKKIDCFPIGVLQSFSVKSNIDDKEKITTLLN